jgi:hypothetical protein
MLFASRQVPPRSLYRTYEIGPTSLSNSYAPMSTLAPRMKEIRATAGATNLHANDAREIFPKSNNKEGGTSMSVLIVQTTSFIAMIAPKLRALYLMLLRAIDAYAAVRVRHAVPGWQVRKVQREIDRCHRLMHPQPGSHVDHPHVQG